MRKNTEPIPFLDHEGREKKLEEHEPFPQKHSTLNHEEHKKNTKNKNQFPKNT